MNLAELTISTNLMVDRCKWRHCRDAVGAGLICVSKTKVDVSDASARLQRTRHKTSNKTRKSTYQRMLKSGNCCCHWRAGRSVRRWGARLQELDDRCNSTYQGNQNGIGCWCWRSGAGGMNLDVMFLRCENRRRVDAMIVGRFGIELLMTVRLFVIL